MNKYYMLFLTFVCLFAIFITKFYPSKENRYDYYMNISDKGTTIYTFDGKFVTYLPFDSTQALDKALIEDNM